MVALLLDGHNLLFRSFTSLPRSIVDRQGRSVNAIYGLLSSVVRLARELEADQLAAAFDVPQVPTFRHLLYPAYQGQRGPLGGEHADEFARQVDIAIQLLPQLGIPALTAPTFEADDIMGTLACARARAGARSVIVSTDRDLLQLVSEAIEVLAPGNPPRVARDEEDVRERLGVPPSGVTTFKALAGDASDNIPGVRGIGTKTAVDLVNRFGSLEAIFDSLESLPPKVSHALDVGRDYAFLFRRVVTVVTDVDLGPVAEQLPQHALMVDSKPRQILEDMGFG
ncbi:MAG TPA: 5'-3' exonuclease [Chloroflexota bacterium]